MIYGIDPIHNDNINSIINELCKYTQYEISTPGSDNYGNILFNVKYELGNLYRSLDEIYNTEGLNLKYIISRS
jgi:hypothetical protein